MTGQNVLNDKYFEKVPMQRKKEIISQKNTFSITFSFALLQ